MGDADRAGVLESSWFKRDCESAAVGHTIANEKARKTKSALVLVGLQVGGAVSIIARFVQDTAMNPIFVKQSYMRRTTD